VHANHPLRGMSRYDLIGHVWAVPMDWGASDWAVLGGLARCAQVRHGEACALEGPGRGGYDPYMGVYGS